MSATPHLPMQSNSSHPLTPHLLHAHSPPRPYPTHIPISHTRITCHTPHPLPTSHTRIPRPAPTQPSGDTFTDRRHAGRVLRCRHLLPSAGSDRLSRRRLEWDSVRLGHGLSLVACLVGHGRTGRCAAVSPAERRPPPALQSGVRRSRSRRMDM